MKQKLVMDLPEGLVLKNALKRDSNTLKDTGDKYKKSMDAMASVWQGASGKSFAEAAGRVEAGFVINRSVLEQMINDVTTAQKSMSEQDAQGAKTVNSMKMK